MEDAKYRNQAFQNVSTNWTLTKIAAGVLLDINFGWDTEEIPLLLKAGGGLNYTALSTKTKGYNPTLKVKEIKKNCFSNFGIEAKGDARYYIGTNIYARFMLEAGFSFLGSFTSLEKKGSHIEEGNDVPVQFALGFNMAGSLGLCYSF